MTYEEWVEAGRPHWQCGHCKRIFVSVAQPDDFVCSLCKAGEVYGTKTE